MLNGYRFRLDPTPEQQQILLRWIGCQRLIYNAKVQEDRYYRRFQRRMVGTAGEAIPVDQAYSRFITERTAFLRNVPSQILRNGAVKFRQAYQRFFQQLGGRPQLKKKSGRQSVWLTSELFQFIPVANETTGEVPGCYQLQYRSGRTPVPSGSSPMWRIGLMPCRRPFTWPSKGVRGGSRLPRMIPSSRCRVKRRTPRPNASPRIYGILRPINLPRGRSAEIAASPSS